MTDTKKEFTEKDRTLIEQFRRIHRLQHAMFIKKQMNGENNREAYNENRVLAMIKLQPAATEKEMAYLLGMPIPLVAELVEKLIKEELLVSRSDEQGSFTLSEAGLERVAKKNEKDSEDELFNGLDATEQARLSELLGRVIQELESQFSDEDMKQLHAFMHQGGRCQEGHFDRGHAGDAFKGRHGHGHGFRKSGRPDAFFRDDANFAGFPFNR